MPTELETQFSELIGVRVSIRLHEPEGGRIVLAPGMRCDVVIDAVGAPGERYPVQELFSPREQYVLMDLAYDAAPRITDRLAPLAPLAANPVKEPNLKRAKTHEIVFGGGMMGNLHQALLDGKLTDMRGLLRRGKAWAIKANGAHRVANASSLETLRRVYMCVSLLL